MSALVAATACGAQRSISSSTRCTTLSSALAACTSWTRRSPSACVADLVIAGSSAVFRLPETSLGVVPAQIAAFLVERVGASQARRLAVTGGQLDAAQALAIGLVHEVHADGDALDAALAATLAQILRCAPGAIAATKALMARALHTPSAELIEDAARLFARAARGPEGVEGMTAFLQKRAPAWAAP